MFLAACQIIFRFLVITVITVILWGPQRTSPEEMVECKWPFPRVVWCASWCVVVCCCVTGVYVWYMKVYEAYARRLGGVCGVRGDRELTHTFPASFPVHIGN